MNATATATSTTPTFAESLDFAVCMWSTQLTARAASKAATIMTRATKAEINRHAFNCVCRVHDAFDDMIIADQSVTITLADGPSDVIDECAGHVTDVIFNAIRINHLSGYSIARNAHGSYTVTW